MWAHRVSTKYGLVAGKARAQWATKSTRRKPAVSQPLRSRECKSAVGWHERTAECTLCSREWHDAKVSATGVEKIPARGGAEESEALSRAD
jgi:hypothetical protein